MDATAVEENKRHEGWRHFTANLKVSSEMASSQFRKILLNDQDEYRNSHSFGALIRTQWFHTDQGRLHTPSIMLITGTNDSNKLGSIETLKSWTV